MIAIPRFVVRPIRSPVQPVIPAQPVVPDKPIVCPPVIPKQDESKEAKEAPLVGIDIHVELIDFCAQIKQTQRFRNNEDSALEASFEFELPKGCAVSSFEADVGERHLTGTVKEKETAKDDYDDALAAGHSAALMESKEDDPNTFCVQLGNVASHQEAFVTITYEVLANMEDDKLVLTLNGSDAKSIIFAEPPTNTPESDARVKPGFSFDVRVATKTAIKSVSSPSHPISLELDNGCAIVRLADGADWKENKHFVLEVKVDDPHQTSVRVQKANDTQVAMVSFYPRIETPQTKCEMVFVLDRSGSMSGSAIECAKNTLQFFLRSLPLEAYFNIVSFGSQFQRFKPESVPFNDENLDAATAYVSEFRANLGGTNIYEPLDSIFKQPTKPGYPRQVFILTDGEVNNKESCIELVKKNANTTRLFSFGIGSSVDKDLVDGMARAGQGSSSIVRDSSSIRQNVMKQLERALQPGLTDVHVTWNDISTGKPLPDGSVRQSPTNPPPVFRGSRLVSFALLPEGCPACKVVLTGSFGDSQYTSEIDIDPAKAENVPGEQIVKLGIRSMIQDIQSGIGGIPQDEIQKVVTELSVKHKILSKFTAFVAIGSGGEALEGSMVTKRVARRHFGRGVCHGFGMAAPMMFGVAPMAAPMANSMMFATACGMARPSQGRVPPKCSGPKPLAFKKCAVPKMRCAKKRSLIADDDDDDEIIQCEANIRTGGRCEKTFEDVKKPALEPSLDNVILQQKASGCFSETALSLLGVPSSAISAVPKDVPAGVDEKLAHDIWVTLLAIVGLQKKFADKSSEWSFIAKKSENWVKSKLGASYDAWNAAAVAAF